MFGGKTAMPKSSTKGRGTSRGRGDERDFATVCAAARGSGVARAAGAVTTAAALFVTTHYQNFDSRVSTLKNSMFIPTNFKINVVCIYSHSVKRKPLPLI